MIDPVTIFVEIVRYNNKSANRIGQLFKDVWLSLYPRPMKVIHDPGPKFRTGVHNMLHANGIVDHSTTVKNATANAICERVHLTIGNVLRTMIHTSPPQDTGQANDLIDHCLATAMHTYFVHHLLRNVRCLIDSHWKTFVLIQAKWRCYCTEFAAFLVKLNRVVLHINVRFRKEFISLAARKDVLNAW
jgi:hypothetical protein